MLDLIFIIAGVWLIVALPLAILIGRLIRNRREYEEFVNRNFGTKQDETVSADRQILFRQLLQLQKKAKSKRRYKPRGPSR